MKQPTSFRLTDTALQLLKVLADTRGVSQASILEMAVREMAKRDGISIQGKEKKQ